MKVLKVITNKDAGYKNKKVIYQLRKAARAVLFNKNKVALLYVSKYKYHKIPGGGLKPNENIKSALKREVKEETGCDVSIKRPIGKIIEYRDDFKLKQLSYCYIANVVGKPDKPSFTKKEKRHGFSLKWVKLDKAIELLKKDATDDYEGNFIIKRDLEFLLKAKKFLT